MKKSIFTKWRVRLTIAIILLLVVYLLIESFLSGYREVAGL